jgi:hypothetical protein
MLFFGAWACQGKENQPFGWKTNSLPGDTLVLRRGGLEIDLSHPGGPLDRTVARRGGRPSRSRMRGWGGQHLDTQPGGVPSVLCSRPPSPAGPDCCPCYPSSDGWIPERALERRLGLLTGRPMHAPPPQKVQMQMKHGLPGALLAVHDQSIAALVHSLIDGDLSRRLEEPRDFGGMGLSHVVCGRDVHSGHDQHVYGSLRMNVAKRDNLVVLVEKVGVHLALDDAAEKARVVHE